MTDLRQGVTEVEHQVLDKAAELLALHLAPDPEFWLELAKTRLAQAKRTTDRTGTASAYMIEVAAAAMLFVEGQRRYLAKLRGGQ